MLGIKTSLKVSNSSVRRLLLLIYKSGVYWWENKNSQWKITLINIDNSKSKINTVIPKPQRTCCSPIPEINNIGKKNLRETFPPKIGQLIKKLRPQSNLNITKTDLRYLKEWMILWHNRCWLYINLAICMCICVDMSRWEYMYIYIYIYIYIFIYTCVWLWVNHRYVYMHVYLCACPYRGQDIFACVCWVCGHMYFVWKPLIQPEYKWRPSDKNGAVT